MYVFKYILLLTVTASTASWLSGQIPRNTTLPTMPAETDVSTAVLPLNSIKFTGLHVTGKYGTAFCLDQNCRLVVTNYHVAVIAKVSHIEGHTVLRCRLATGPTDDGATLNGGPEARTLKYTLRRDLAILELSHPLAKHHGLRYEMTPLHPGQAVEIYSYSRASHPRQRRLQVVQATYEGDSPDGLLVLRYVPTDKGKIQPGASGGVAVDRRTHGVVGILNAMGTSSDDVGLAVPVEELAEFVGKVEPFLASEIFPVSTRIPPSAVDLYPELVALHSEQLKRRNSDSMQIQVLRSKAQALSDNMRDFIALQNLSWGEGSSEPAAVTTMEVRMIEGYQRFREYPDGHKDLVNMPMPPLNHAIVMGSEWASLPKMVGTEFDLQILQEPDTDVNGQRIKIFRYRADAEDNLCRFRATVDYGLFGLSRETSVSCYGEVWADQGMNILRISEHYKLLGSWQYYQAVVTYGWIEVAKEAPKLVPRTIRAQAERGPKVYWCQGEFSDYRHFTSSVRIAPPGEEAPVEWGE